MHLSCRYPLMCVWCASRLRLVSCNSYSGSRKLGAGRDQRNGSILTVQSDELQTSALTLGKAKRSKALEKQHWIFGLVERHQTQSCPHPPPVALVRWRRLDSDVRTGEEKPWEKGRERKKKRDKTRHQGQKMTGLGIGSWTGVWVEQATQGSGSGRAAASRAISARSVMW